MNKHLFRASALAGLLLPAAGAVVGAPLADAHFRDAASRSISGKPFSSGVIVESPTRNTAEVGETFEVRIDFSGVTEHGAKVKFTSTPAIVLSGEVPAELAEGKTTVTIRAKAIAAGRSFINVFSRQGDAASVVSIPIQVGPVEAKASRQGDIQKGLGGRDVSLLPALVGR